MLFGGRTWTRRERELLRCLHLGFGTEQRKGGAEVDCEFTSIALRRSLLFMYNLGNLSTNLLMQSLPIHLVDPP